MSALCRFISNIGQQRIKLFDVKIFSLCKATNSNKQTKDIPDATIKIY
jgi:hypothetical protein